MPNLQTEYPNNLSGPQKEVLTQLCKGYPSYLVNWKTVKALHRMHLLTPENELKPGVRKEWMARENIDPNDRIDPVLASLDACTIKQLQYIQHIESQGIQDLSHLNYSCLSYIAEKGLLNRVKGQGFVIKEDVVAIWPEWTKSNPEKMAEVAKLPEIGGVVKQVAAANAAVFSDLDDQNKKDYSILWPDHQKQVVAFLDQKLSPVEYNRLVRRYIDFALGRSSAKMEDAAA
ncbi:MAG: hypothetical protein AAGA46_00105 [Cyanobacteria bacterium P01_F01_bin.13]